MVFETTDEFVCGAHPHDVFNDWAQTRTSTSYDEANTPYHTPMRRASPMDEVDEESPEDGQGRIGIAEGMMKDRDTNRARAGENARREKAKNQSLKAAMECGVCLSVIRNPQMLDCGHSACVECLRSWWTRPRDKSGLEDSVVSTDGEDHEGEVVPPPRRPRFQCALKRTKECPTCRKIITRRPVPNLMLNNLVKILSRSSPQVQAQEDEREPPKDVWRGIFPEEPEPTDPERVNKQRREEVQQIRLELGESLERHHRDLETTVERINRLQVLILQERNEAVERWMDWANYP